MRRKLVGKREASPIAVADKETMEQIRMYLAEGKRYYTHLRTMVE